MPETGRRSAERGSQIPDECEPWVCVRSAFEVRECVGARDGIGVDWDA